MGLDLAGTVLTQKKQWLHGVWAFSLRRLRRSLTKTVTPELHQLKGLAKGLYKVFMGVACTHS